MIRLPKLNDCDEYTTYSHFIIVHIVPKDIIIHTIIPYSVLLITNQTSDFSLEIRRYM